MEREAKLTQAGPGLTIFRWIFELWVNQVPTWIEWLQLRDPKINVRDLDHLAHLHAVTPPPRGKSIRVISV